MRKVVPFTPRQRRQAQCCERPALIGGSVPGQLQTDRGRGGGRLALVASVSHLSIRGMTAEKKSLPVLDAQAQRHFGCGEIFNALDNQIALEVARK